MIHSICIKNFQGSTGEFHLDQHTVITGDNGSGKSTLIKALQLLFLKTVPDDEVNDTADEQYQAYCGEESGEMSIEVTNKRGSLKKVWSQSNGKVSTKATFNTQFVPASTDFSDLMGVSIFNVSQFWRMTPSAQIAVICDLAGVDPKELDRLDEELEATQTQKKDFLEKLNHAQNALKDHDKEIQELVEKGRHQEDINVANAEQEIVDLEKEIHTVSNQILEVKTSEAESKTRSGRIKDIHAILSRNTSELEHLHVPDNTLSTQDLDEELRKQQALKDTVELLQRHQERIKLLRSTPEPIPPAYGDQDIRELQEKIRLAQSGKGLREEDRVSYDIGCKIFDRIKHHEPLLHEAERIQCLQIVSDVVEVHKQAVVAAEAMVSSEQIERWKREIKNIEGLRAQYHLNYTAYIMNQKEANSLQIEVEELGTMKFDESYYHRLCREADARHQEYAEIENKKARYDELIRENHDLKKELDTLNDKQDQSSSNLTFLELQRKNLEEQQCHLKEHIRVSIEYEKLNQIRAKKLGELDQYSSEADRLKTKEMALIHEKAGLLKQVEETLTTRANRIVHPARVSFELPRTLKKRDRIRFWLHQINGDVIDRQTLCGSEQVEFDMGLAYALVGDGGLVSAEVAELTEARLNSLVEKVIQLTNESNAQVLIVGHTLSRFEQDPRIAILSMDQQLSPKFVG